MIKEISRRAMSALSEGIACGPVSVYAADAEIVVENEGKNIYLHTEWVLEADEDILFEATTESLYNCYERLNRLLDEDNHEEFEAEIEKRDKIAIEKDIRTVFGNVDIYERYAEQYREMLKMMQELLDKDAVDYDLLSMDEEEK